MTTTYIYGCEKCRILVHGCTKAKVKQLMIEHSECVDSEYVFNTNVFEMLNGNVVNRLMGYDDEQTVYWSVDFTENSRKEVKNVSS